MDRHPTSFNDLPLTLRVEDLMPILNIGRNTAYELVRSDQIKSVRIGRQIRIPKENIRLFLEGGSSPKNIYKIRLNYCRIAGIIAVDSRCAAKGGSFYAARQAKQERHSRRRNDSQEGRPP